MSSIGRSIDLKTKKRLIIVIIIVTLLVPLVREEEVKANGEPDNPYSEPDNEAERTLEHEVHELRRTKCYQDDKQGCLHSVYSCKSAGRGGR